MNFLPIRIGTLRPGEAVHFDIFILIADKHVHYIRTADEFDPDRIERLRSKGVKKLYIPETSETAYLAYLDAGLNQLQNQTLSVQERSALVGSTMVTEAENAIHNIETEQGYKRTEGRIQKVVDFLTSESGALKNILASTGAAIDNFQHSANVTNLALSLANRLGIKSARDILDIGLAGLLHDSAVAKLGFAPDTVPGDLPLDQLKKYQEHPTAAAHLLAGKPYIDRNVLELIANHEEVGEGLGFPNKKRLSTLPIGSQILNLCDTYDHFATAKKMPPLEAAKIFFNDKIGVFNLDHIKALMAMLK